MKRDREEHDPAQNLFNPRIFEEKSYNYIYIFCTPVRIKLQSMNDRGQIFYMVNNQININVYLDIY